MDLNVSFGYNDPLPQKQFKSITDEWIWDKSDTIFSDPRDVNAVMEQIQISVGNFINRPVDMDELRKAFFTELLADGSAAG